MYVFYEHHKDAFGKIMLTELRLSSYKPNFGIAFRNKRENTLFEALKIGLKEAPIAQRSYDDTTKLWSYLDDWGIKTLARLQVIAAAFGGLVEVETQDMQTCARLQRWAPTTKKPKAEDFFYNYGQPVSTPALSRSAITAKLAFLLEITEATLSSTESSELKKLYRRAALRLHPDRNNGDGSKMSDLNMIWQLYTAN